MLLTMGLRFTTYMMWPEVTGLQLIGLLMIYSAVTISTTVIAVMNSSGVYYMKH